MSVLLAAAPAVDALGKARAGRAHAREAERALRAQDAAAARQAFTAAEEAFARAEQRLGSPLTLGVRAIPLAGRQLRAARAIAQAGTLGARAGLGAVRALEAAPPGGWRLRGGGLDVEALRRAADALHSGIPAAEHAEEVIADSPDTLLIGPVDRARSEAERVVGAGARGLRRGAAALDAAPALLGGDGLRRYFIGFANLAELRGAGGFIGFYAVLEAEEGKLRYLADTGRPTREFPQLRELELTEPRWHALAYRRYGATRIWQNVNMSSDFPTVGRLIAEATPEPPGPVDGAIQVDPPGVAALMRLTGPVTVENWPEPITVQNVERIAQHEVYLRYPDSSRERTAFFSRLIEAVFRQLNAADIPLGMPRLEALADAVDGGHIQVYSSDAAVQAALERSRISRTVDRAESATDVLGFVTQNAVGNKIDWFLRRRVGYTVALDPESGDAEAQFEAVLHNPAPSSGLPPYVIGSATEEVTQPGTNRQLTILVRSPGDQLPRPPKVDGTPTPTSADRERDLRTYHSIVRIPPGGRAAVTANFVVPDALTGEGRHRTYRLHVLRQPVAHPDVYRLRIAAPPGWKLDGQSSWEGELTRDLILEVELTQTLRAWAFESAVLRPFRLAWQLLGDLF